MKLTPQQSADKLVEQYMNAEDEKGFINLNDYRHIKCALIDVQNRIDDYSELTDDNSSWEGYKEKVISKLKYYQEVKQILESKL